MIYQECKLSQLSLTPPTLSLERIRKTGEYFQLIIQKYFTISSNSDRSSERITWDRIF